MNVLAEIINRYGTFQVINHVIVDIQDNLPDFLYDVDEVFSIDDIEIQKDAVYVMLKNTRQHIRIDNYEGCLFSNKFWYVKRLSICYDQTSINIARGHVKYLFLEPDEISYDAARAAYSQLDSVQYVNASMNLSYAIACKFKNIWMHKISDDDIHLIQVVKDYLGTMITCQYRYPQEKFTAKNVLCVEGSIVYSTGPNTTHIENFSTINTPKLYIQSKTSAYRFDIKPVFCNPHIKYLHVIGFIYGTDYTIEDIRENYSLLKLSVSKISIDIAFEIQSILKRNQALAKNTKSARKV